MQQSRNHVLAFCLCAGCACGMSGGDEPLVTLEPSSGRVVDVAHIYYNIGTGERVVTLLGDGQVAPADNGVSDPIWSSRVSNQCADYGYTSELFYGFDNNAGTTSLATGISVLDYGDIALDTVVDCVHIDWVTDHDDVDLDGDGIGDGVPGLGAQWIWWDLDNGRSPLCCRLPLIILEFADLPGDFESPGDSGSLAKYSVDIDLAASFSSSMTFEIGDFDGDPQGAAHHNAFIATFDNDFDGFPDTDLDGDGLFDWSWSVRFFQPGTADLDGDGVIDGNFADSMKTIGISFGAPEGTAIDNGDGTWTWEIDTTIPDPGTGQEDRYAIYAPPNIFGEIHYVGGYWFGGFKCEGLPQSEGGPGYTPAAMFEHQLFGPGGGDCCPVDLNCNGALNFFDISVFLSLFSAMDPQADFTGDGVFNFFDISAFLSEFSAGCP